MFWAIGSEIWGKPQPFKVPVNGFFIFRPATNPVVVLDPENATEVPKRFGYGYERSDLTRTTG